MKKEIENILDLLDVQPMRVIDIGASGGVWSYFEKYLGSSYVEIILVEPSEYHSKELISMYSKYSNVVVDPIGLFENDCNKTLNYSNTGGASLFSNNFSLLKEYVEHYSNGIPENMQCTVDLVSSKKWVESLVEKQLIGLKLDTQGCELNILKDNNYFSSANFIAMEAPFGHKYKEQASMSEYFRYYEENLFDIYDIVPNYQTFVKSGKRSKYINDIFNLNENNTSQKDSIFKPRIMDGDIFGIKQKLNNNQTSIKKRFISFITLNYFVEAYELVDEIDLNDNKKQLIKNNLVKIIQTNSTLRDRFKIVKKIYNLRYTLAGRRLMHFLHIIPKFIKIK
jgi:FkbM family methyltransferase